MWELDHKESWARKNWCFWTVVLEKTLESPVDSKVIQSVHPKGYQSWIFIGWTETETAILWPPDAKNWFIDKDPDAGKDWGWEEKVRTEDEIVGWHHGLNGRGQWGLAQFSCSAVSNSLWPHELQLTRLSCPSPTPRAYSNSCPLSWWCHPTISSSVIPFSSNLQSFPASGSFPMSWLLHQVAKVLELQHQHQSFKWIFRADFL